MALPEIMLGGARGMGLRGITMLLFSIAYYRGELIIIMDLEISEEHLQTLKYFTFIGDPEGVFRCLPHQLRSK